MSNPLRRLAAVLGALLLLAFAHERILSADFVGQDYPVLARAAAAEPGEEPPPLWRLGAADFYRVEGEGGSLLPGVWLSLSRRWWGGPGETTGLPYRLENLLLLVLVGTGMARFLRRFLQPWTGHDQATSAGWAAGLLISVHPVIHPALGAVGGRGPLLALAASAWSASLFLRGRQDREVRGALGAGALAVVASAAGEAALALPLLLAVAELVSAHRYRPMRVRVRTTLTTLVGASALVALAPLARSFTLGERVAPGLTSSLEELGRGELLPLVSNAVEKLGVLLLPVNAHAGGLLAIIFAGLLFLVALQPALLAARSAPRLWTWFLFWWLFAVAVAGVPGAGVRVHPGDLVRARTLLVSCAAMSVALGVLATARSGAWRVVLPAVLGLGYGLLSRVNEGPWVHAAEEVERLRADVEAARELEGREHRLLVLDPPRTVEGVAAVGDSLTWVLDRRPDPALGSLEAPVLGLSRAAFSAFVQEREFADLRAQGLLVVFPRDVLGTGAGGRRDSVLLGAEDPSSGPRFWRGDSRSPNLDWEPATAGALRVVAPAGTDTSRPQVLSWRAREAAARNGSVSGAWLDRGTEAPVAFFDLASSPAWWLGGRIRRVWFEEGLPAVQRAELLPRVPGLGDLEPDPQEDDWYFPPPESPEVAAAGGAGSWWVGLLDLGTLEYVELPVVAGPSRTLRVEGASAEVARTVRETGGPVAWALEHRVDGVAVARARGRRVGVRGSREESSRPDQ